MYFLAFHDEAGQWYARDRSLYWTKAQAIVEADQFNQRYVDQRYTVMDADREPGRTVMRETGGM